MSISEESLRELSTAHLKLLVAQLGLEADRRSRTSMTHALLDCRALTTTRVRELAQDATDARRIVNARNERHARVGRTPVDPAPARRVPAPHIRLADDVFVAIDFETANPSRDSACSVGLVRVERGVVVREEHRLIRPPTPDFWPMNVGIHGITWRHVAREPDFRTVWRELQPVIAGARTFVAHCASFDKSVLTRCCAHYRMPCPELPFECTRDLAKETWSLSNFRLETVCGALRIPLDHHNALSDARACAAIYLRARARTPV